MVVSLMTRLLVDHHEDYSDILDTFFTFRRPWAYGLDNSDIPTSMMRRVSDILHDTFLERKPQNSRNAEKTLGWSTIIPARVGFDRFDSQTPLKLAPRSCYFQSFLAVLCKVGGPEAGCETLRGSVKEGAMFLDVFPRHTAGGVATFLETLCASTSLTVIVDILRRSWPSAGFILRGAEAGSGKSTRREDGVTVRSVIPARQHLRCDERYTRCPARSLGGLPTNCLRRRDLACRMVGPGV